MRTPSASHTLQHATKTRAGTPVFSITGVHPVEECTAITVIKVYWKQWYSSIVHGVHVYDHTASQKKLVKLSTKDR